MRKHFSKWREKGQALSGLSHALDIGSRNLTLAAGVLGRDDEIGGLAVEMRPSRGIFKGVVNDIAALSGAVQEVLEKMEARTSVKARQVFLSVSGNYINARHNAVVMALSEHGTRSITRRDIERLNHQAKILGVDLDETLLHEYPQGYCVDRHSMTLNPLSLHGRRFEMDTLLVSAKSSYLDNIAKSVEQAGCDVAGIVFSGVAAAESVLSPEEKERGAVMVDIGEALTNVLVFKDGILRRLNVLSFGARNLSDIIANFFKIPLDAADAVKEAIEIEHEIAADEEAMVKTGEDYKAFRKAEIVALVTPELDRFTAMLKGILTEGVCAEALRNPVTAVGGLSLLDGFLEKMERDLHQPVRLGIPRGFKDAPPAKAVAYASSIGLLYWQQKLMRKSFLGIPAQRRNQFARAFDYIVHLYQDYF